MDDKVLQETEASRPSEQDAGFSTISESQLGAAPKPEQQRAHEKPVSERLQDLVERDEQYRSKVDPDRINKALHNPEEKQKFLEEMRLTDRVNRAAVQEMIDKGELQTAQDFIDASLIFQHGEVPNDFLLAFNLSSEAIKKGAQPDHTLLAQAFDRYMVESQLQQGVPIEGITQRFGTQEYPDPTNEGVLMRPTIDGQATEAELAFLGMIPASADATRTTKAVLTSLQNKLLVAVPQ